MGTWHNTASHTIRFDIDRDRFEVSAGDECEIPRAFEYVPPLRGLPLKKGPSPMPNAKRVEPVEATRPSYPLPPGVEQGRSRKAGDEDPDLVDEDKGGDPDDGVANAAAALQQQGVKLPRRK